MSGILNRHKWAFVGFLFIRQDFYRFNSGVFRSHLMEKASQKLDSKLTSSQKPYQKQLSVLNIYHWFCLTQALVFIVWKRSQELRAYGCQDSDDCSFSCRGKVVGWDGAAYLFLNFQALDFLLFRSVLRGIDQPFWHSFVFKALLELVIFLGNLCVTFLLFNDFRELSKQGCSCISFCLNGMRQIEILQGVTLFITFFFIISNSLLFIIKKRRLKWIQARTASPRRFTKLKPNNKPQA